MVVHQARKHLIDFEIATDPHYSSNWHHEVIANELEHLAEHGDRDYKILILMVPPRHGKTRQATIDFPAWLLGKNPNNEIITASYSSELAQDFGTKTRTLVQSPEYQAIFNTRLKEDEQSKAKWRTSVVDGTKVKPANGSYTSVGVGGPITGRGANFLIIDDPIRNREEAESEVYREKTWDWFTSTAFTRLEPKGVVILILTRWHQDDLAGRVLGSELAKRAKVLKFSAFADFDEEHRKKGEALWPNKYNEHALYEIKNSIGPYDFAALYQQTPILTENQEFKPEWYRPITQLEVDRMNTRNFLTVDTAMSKKTDADYTGLCDNAVNRENFWHLKAWRMRLGPEELVDLLFTLYLKRRYEKIGIEKTAYLEGLKPFLDSEQRKRGIHLPIVELKHNQSVKETRIRGLQPRYANGSIFHIEGECKDLEEEQMSFPLGVHDDVLDAEAYQLQIAENAYNNRNQSYTPQFREFKR